MIKRNWNKRLAMFVAGGIFFASTSSVWANPVELTLDEAISMALKTNPTVKVAEAEKDKAQGAVKEVQGIKGPKIDYGFSATHAEQDLGAQGPTRHEKDNYANNLTLSMPIYTGGKIEGAINIAEIKNEAAAKGITKAQQEVKLSATSSYYDVLKAENMLKIAEESVDMLKAHLKNAQAHYEVGTVAKSDVLRSEVELANAEQNLIKAQNGLNLGISNLNNVIGMPLDTNLDAKDTEFKYTKYALTMDEAINHAMDNRPEVAQVDMAVRASKEGVEVARAGKMPTIAVGGAYNLNEDKFPGSDKDSEAWQVGVSLNLNILDTGVTKGQVTQAKADVRKSEEIARQTKDAVKLEVRQAYLNMEEAEKRIQTSKVAVDKAEEDYKIAQTRYSAGVGTNLDVMDSQLALTQAKTNHVQATFDYNVSKAKLDKAIGNAI